jgi:hypothetical protein
LTPSAALHFLNRTSLLSAGVISVHFLSIALTS